MSNLREKVIVALLAAQEEWPIEQAERWIANNEDERNRLTEEADAVLSLVVEECAKIAEGYDGDGLSPGDGYHAQLGDASKTQREIVDAIRAITKPL